MQLRTVLGLGLLLSVGAVAQQGDHTYTFNGGEFSYMRTEFGAGRLVKGAPYSAQAVTQHTQTLPDGNKIQRSTTSSIVRDSEGRTRQEHTVGSIGGLAASGTAAKSVVIHDPVAGTFTTLDPSSRSARVSHQQHSVNFNQGGGDASSNSHGRMQAHTRGQNPNVTTEDLGTKVIEGLSVQGKRMTHTIPAGQIGNAAPIQSITETWYSADLHAVVMSKTIDPRNGETDYQLTNISRAEPDAALFQVPGDYTVTDNANAPGGPRGMMRRGGPKQ